MVSGFTRLATSSNACLLSFLPISASMISDQMSR
jgi:hypothetical protein